MSLTVLFRFQSVLPLALVVSPLLLIMTQPFASAQSDLLPVLEPNPELNPETPLPPLLPPLRREPPVDPPTESIPAVPASPVTPPISQPVTPPISQPFAPPQVDPSSSDRAPIVDPYNFTPTTIDPTPFDGKVSATLSALPDGSYRYLAGAAEPRVYSNTELDQQGGSIFLLSKVGNRVTGYLLPGIGRLGLCITGIASGNNITGTAYANAPSQSLEMAASPYGSILQLQNIRIDSSGLEFANAVININSYSMINVGSTLPPTECGGDR